MPRAPFPIGRKLLLLLAFVGIGIGGTWWWQRPPPEPVQVGGWHDGQRLSELLRAGPEAGDYGRKPTAEELHAFGPGTVPWLAYTAEHGRHPFKREGPLPFDHAPARLRRWVPEMWGGLRPGPSIDDRPEALYALCALGPEAAPAIPTFVKILERENQGDQSAVDGLAARALHATGPSSWPVVEQLLEHVSRRSQEVLFQEIRTRLDSGKEPAPDTEVAKVVAVLIKGFGDPNASVRVFALQGFSACRIGVERPNPAAFDAAITEVTRLLSDSDELVRTCAAGALRECGAGAADAVPRLIEALDDPAWRVRNNAAFALRTLDRKEKHSAARLRIMVRDDPKAQCKEAATSALKELGLSPDDEGTSGGTVPAR